MYQNFYFQNVFSRSSMISDEGFIIELIIMQHILFIEYMLFVMSPYSSSALAKGFLISLCCPPKIFLPALFPIFMGNGVHQTPLGSKDGIIGAKQFN